MKGSGDTVKEQLATVEQRVAAGREARERVPRSAHASWTPATDRLDPVTILGQQVATRLPQLLPIRYARMADSPFGFLRGSAAIMAADLATTSTSGLRVQLCGDAHLANFGLYASPERELLFDVNDFDETLPGPWEWDVKRLAASSVVAARSNGGDADRATAAALAVVGAYRRSMRDLAGLAELTVWYTGLRAADLAPLARSAAQRRRGERLVDAARHHDNLQAFDKLTRLVDGRRRIVDDPPLLVHPAPDEMTEPIEQLYAAYRRSLPDDRSHLAGRFQVVDAARKVVGVGSVGTRCYIVLLTGRDHGDPLLLQVKQAEPSVLEEYAGASSHATPGERVVAGQRLMQAASDIFLGWTSTSDTGRHYYWRQLRDMKGSVSVAGMSPGDFTDYAALCGQALARAHARTGDRIAIAAYLGASDTFDRAVAAFAHAYADQTKRDHSTLIDAIRSGRVPATVPT
jgi:uncharacterized protein (DUF2252 family)